MTVQNCETYQKNLGQRPADGGRALTVFVAVMALVAAQGAVYRSALPVAVLASTNVVVPILDIALVLGVVRGERGSWREWRLGAGALGAVAAGVCGGAVLGLGRIGFLALGGAAVRLVLPNLADGLIFIICAAEEELIFRGYIETRLYGACKSALVCSGVTAVFFLLSHYPVHWVVSGTVSLDAVSGLHVVFILLLHLACSGIYRRSGCIWAAVALHFCYNLLSGMLIAA